MKKSSRLIKVSVGRDGDAEVFVMNANDADVYSTGQIGSSADWG